MQESKVARKGMNDGVTKHESELELTLLARIYHFSLSSIQILSY